ncbi:uncharacterized protein PFB0765w-like [Gouania willdenowi]|uniref:uncharacterized protein PFB0765w-like n=1 Tax=Gouania willdenowi TaxID=441366 RepID=UPI001054F836|nr:uncharacterized protein PFB0765w-like [Gouania willdenowi]
MEKTNITAQTEDSSDELSCYEISSNDANEASFHQNGKKNQAWEKKDCHSFNEPENDASKPPQKCKTEEPADLNQSAAAPGALSETQHGKHHGSDDTFGWVEEKTQMLNREKEMDFILQKKNDEIANLRLSLDQAQQEQKMKLEKKDLMLEIKEEEISYLSLLLDEFETELDLKSSEWEDSLELNMCEVREKVQAQKKQLDEEKAALLDVTNELQNKEQMFLKQKTEYENNISNMNSVLKQNNNTIDEQQKTISHLETTLIMKEDDLKTRTDQWNQMVAENEKAVKAITEMEAHSSNENQSKQTLVQLQTALDEAEKRLMEMEEERSNHTITMSIMKATLTETQEAFNNLQAKFWEQKKEKEKKDLMLELKEEDISDLSLLLDEFETELDLKSSQWEDSLELNMREVREKVQAQKKQLDEEKAALLDVTNELQNKEQMFLKQKTEYENNISNMNSVLKQNNNTRDEQQKTISHLETTLIMKEDDLKTRTDQWNQMVAENEKVVKAFTVHCSYENQSKQKLVQLQTALDDAEKRLMEMEEERSNHTITMSIMKAMLTETQEAFNNLQAIFQEQKKEKEEKKKKRKEQKQKKKKKKAASKDKPSKNWFKNLFRTKRK